MRFRIEATEPTSASDLQATLEKARDEWAATTPQEHPLDSQEAVALRNSQETIDGARTEHKGMQAPNTLSKLVEAHAALIKSQSQKPTAALVGAIQLIDRGIKAACAAAGSMPVRVAIVGHFNDKPDPRHGLQGNHERLAIHIDDAKYG